MPRKDYNYLIEHFNDEMQSRGYYAVKLGDGGYSILKIGNVNTVKYERAFNNIPQMVDIDVFHLMEHQRMMRNMMLH